MILPFKQFNGRMLTKLNRWLSEFNKLNDLRGDEFILIKKSGAGTTVGFNLAKARARIAKKSGSEGSSVVRAACTADAGSGATIAATLFASDGTTGDAITVYCNISNGTALNAATPRLETADEIFVTKSNFDNAGTPESRYYCVSNFMATEDCTCEAADAVFNSVTIASDEKLTLSGVGGNTYVRHNSADGEVEHTVEGDKVTTW